MYEMGLQYGKAAGDELRQTLEIIKEYYTSLSVNYSEVTAKAHDFRDRYASARFERFTAAMAEGAGISIDDAWVLSGQETIGSLKSKFLASAVVIHIKLELLFKCNLQQISSVTNFLDHDSTILL